MKFVLEKSSPIRVAINSLKINTTPTPPPTLIFRSVKKKKIPFFINKPIPFFLFYCYNFNFSKHIKKTELKNKYFPL